MLERIMDLHILLYLMAVLGTAGGVATRTERIMTIVVRPSGVELVRLHSP